MRSTAGSLAHDARPAIDATGGYAPSAKGLWLPERLARRPIAVDLFCGCGGFSLGFMQGGFEVVAGLDNDPLSMLTYLGNLGSCPAQIHYVTPEDEERAERVVKKAVLAGDRAGQGWISHHPDVPPVRHFFLGDVRKVSGQDILDALGLEVGELDCVMGGPPCQGFSTAGKRDVMDPRNSLIFEFARLVLEMRPKMLVMENVPGILKMVTSEGLSVVDELCRVLEDGGFGATDALKRSLLATSGSGAALRGRVPEKREKREPYDPAQLGLFGEEGEQLEGEDECD